MDSIFNTMPLAVFAPLLIVRISRLAIRGERSIAAVGVVSSASCFMDLFHRPIFELLKAGPFPSRPDGPIVYLLLVGMPLVIGLSWQGQRIYDRAIDRLLPDSRCILGRG